MGCTEEQGDHCESDEKPAHSVTLSDFYIGKYEVTQKLWMSVMGENPSYKKGDDLPVENINWRDAQKFIAKLNSLTGKRYRLPTEAEWEYAARGGAKSRGYMYAGSNNRDDVAWDPYNNRNKTNPVGIKAPNELGIYDMSGNVWEWVSDMYERQYSPDAQTNPVVPSELDYEHVMRGGGYGYGGGWDCRVSGRGQYYDRAGFLGFRLAHDAKGNE